MNNSEITFDELDLKFFEEFPLIVDVFSSTFSKIARLIKSLQKDCSQRISLEIADKENWGLSRENGTINFFPFTDAADSEVFIEELQNCFIVRSRVKVYKKQEKKVITFFCVDIAFEYDPTNKNKPYIYFQISKENPTSKNGGINYPIEFYEKISKANNFTVEFSHPSDDYQSEIIWVEQDNFDYNVIKDTYDSFKEKILEPYLTNFNWQNDSHSF